MRHEARNPKQVERTFAEYLIGDVNIVALDVASCWNCSHVSPYSALPQWHKEYHASVQGSVAYFVHRDADGTSVCGPKRTRWSASAAADFGAKQPRISLARHGSF